jgi:glycosyltransferase involved in cell wall biosynthesis
MHLAVDASAVSRDHRGMGRYARLLLSAMPLERPNMRYTLFARHTADVAVLTEQLRAVPHIMERSTIRPLSEMTQVRCDAAWYPCNFIATVPAAGALIPTVHDLFPMLLLDGRWWKVMKRVRARQRYTRTIARADHVITGASAARDELVATFDLTPDRVSVVPHAADSFRTVDHSAADALLHQLHVTGPFLLAVGSQEPRKNLGVLYEAMRQLHAGGHTIPLVLCGPRGVHGYKSGDALPSWLRHAGFVSDAELAALYARATALVFPSLYEGFGLPVLEAMTAGGTVICSDASTMPEVGGDAVLYFNPRDAGALVTQIRALTDTTTLRRSLVQAGAVQSMKYSWAQSARGTLEAFDRGIAAAALRSRNR